MARAILGCAWAGVVWAGYGDDGDGRVPVRHGVCLLVRHGDGDKLLCRCSCVLVECSIGNVQTRAGDAAPPQLFKWCEGCGLVFTCWSGRIAESCQRGFDGPPGRRGPREAVGSWER
jgi:hypothetical protein